MTIIEDTRQQAGKHEHKHEWFGANGINICRSKLPWGDYAPVPPVSVDTKENMLEIAGNICGKEHTRFINECKNAHNAGCQLIILVENRDGITELSQVYDWRNPREEYSPTCVQGARLHKAMQTIQERYGVRFMFCAPEDSAQIIEGIIREYGK